MTVFDVLRPRVFASSIYHIDVSGLWDAGYRAVLTDLDNTLVEWNSPTATPQLVAWLEQLRERGFQVAIISNNKESRVVSFARPLGIPAFYAARKPKRAAFLRALEMMSVKAKETVMIGDQVFTDILGGNRMGMYTIMVQPIHRREAGGTRLMRLFERVVLREKPW